MKSTFFKKFLVSLVMLTYAFGVSVPMASAFTYATWNPSDISASLSLSGGNLVVTKNLNESSVRSVRANIGNSTGKWYWEQTMTVNTLPIIGIANLVDSVDSWPGQATVNGYTYRGDTAEKYHNGATAYGATYTTGDVIGIALDLDAGTLEFYKNGVSQGVAFTGITGTWYPLATLFYNTNVITSNFGASAFTYSVPSGYNSGFYPASEQPVTSNAGAYMGFFKFFRFR